MPGQVFYLYCDFTTPTPKEKYLLLASVDPVPLFFVINSNINPFIESREYLRVCQVLLGSSDYDFLDHDSYVDTTTAIDCFHLSDIKKQILGDVNRVKGAINHASKEAVVEAVNKSMTLEKRYKKWILASL